MIDLNPLQHSLDELKLHIIILSIPLGLRNLNQKNHLFEYHPLGFIVEYWSI